MFALKVFGGFPSPFGMCASKPWSISSACKNLRGQHPPKGRNIVSRKIQFGWVKTYIQFSVVGGPKFTGLKQNAGGIALDQYVFRFWISWPVPEIFAIKLESCLKSRGLLHVLGPQFLWGRAPRTSHIAIMWQSFTAIGQGSSEVARRIKKHLQ